MSCFVKASTFTWNVSTVHKSGDSRSNPVGSSRTVPAFAQGRPTLLGSVFMITIVKLLLVNELLLTWKAVPSSSGYFCSISILVYRTGMYALAFVVTHQFDNFFPVLRVLF